MGLLSSFRDKKSATSDDVAFLVVGLGNPGEEYEGTRHNAGGETVALLAKELKGNYVKSEGGAKTVRVTHRGNTIILARPSCYMNTSGGPVKQLLSLYGLKPDKLIVIHDELDIDPGSVRVKFGGGHAGHNGLRSICDKLGTKDWFRVRVGIGRPPGKMGVSDFVLSVPKKDAQEDFEHACHLAAQATLSLIDNGLEKTQQDFN